MPSSSPGQDRAGGARTGGVSLGLAALLFALSGAGALVIETLWMRWFRLLLGATAPAVSATLVAFFAGQALGAAWSARRAGGWSRPLRAYGWLELAAVTTGAAVPLLLLASRSLLDAGYDQLLDHPPLLLTARLTAALVATLPAAACFGATLPALVAATVRTPNSLGPRAGLLYGVNTLGAATGTAAAAFWLPEALGVSAGYAVGLGLLLLAGGGALAASRLGAEPAGNAGAAPPHGEPAQAGAAGREPPPAHSPEESVLGTAQLLRSFAALSGMASFAAQVLLVQAFGRVLNQSAYAYGTVLVAVLLALGLGALVVAGLVRGRPTAPPRVLGGSLLLAAIGLAAFPASFVHLTDGLASLSVHGPWPAGGWAAARLVLLTAGPALLGAAGVFPAVLAWAGSLQPGPASRTTGRLLAWNTAGALLGALLAPYVLLPAAGLWPALVAVALVYASMAVALPGSTTGRAMRSAVLLAGLAGVGLAGGSPTRLPALHLAPGERLLEAASTPAGLVAVVERADGRVLQVDNHYALGGSADSIRQQRQGHLPLLLHPAPRRVAFVGSATGSSASAARRHGVEELVLVELVPGVARMAARHFGSENAGIYQDPRTDVVLDDARNWMRATDEQFDVVVADLFVPWRAGTGALYAREHFSAARARLRPGGIFCQWLPLYQLSADELRIVVASFRDVFPEGSLWRGDFFGRHPIVALLGVTGEAPSWAVAAQAAQRLAEAGVDDRWVSHPVGPAALAVAPLSALPEAWATVPLNTDDRPRLEFLAARNHGGGAQPLVPRVTGRAWVSLAKELLERAGSGGLSVWRDPDSQTQIAAEGGHALQAASVLWNSGRGEQAGLAFRAATARLGPELLDPAAPDPSAADAWPAPAPR